MLSEQARPLVAALLLVVALVLASCGGTAAGGSGSGGDMQDAKKTEDKAGAMQGMDHEQMGHGSGGMASEMLMENGKYSDERFIDAMVPHHQGAIEMAEVALENAQHQETGPSPGTSSPRRRPRSSSLSRSSNASSAPRRSRWR